MLGKTETVTLKIGGMHCMHCAAKVEAALKAVRGVKKVEVSLDSATATVIISEGKTTPDALIKAVVDAGFEASEG